MNPDELLNLIRTRLEAAVDPVYLEGVLNYFKESIDPYGVRTPAVKKIAADAYRTWKTWPRAQQVSFSETLWQSGKQEEGSIAIVLNRRVSKRFTAADFKTLEKWINRWVRNWAHTDGVSSWLVAACLENEPAL
ncbi:MAG: DNA alkylation repair protein, partial [bacterium]|nr:DNA alkylation repair protein [bacterium]